MILLSRTGLMIAARRGHSSIVTELVRAGAQMDAQDQVYMQPVCVIVFGFLVTQDLLHAYVCTSDLGKYP